MCCLEHLWQGTMSQLATQPVSQDPHSLGRGDDFQFLEFETQVS